MTKQEQINRFLSEVEGGGSYPNFSKPENFIRLLKIVRNHVENPDLLLAGIIMVQIMKSDKEIDLIPSLVAENLAKSLGWKESQ